MKNVISTSCSFVLASLIVISCGLEQDGNDNKTSDSENTAISTIDDFKHVCENRFIILSDSADISLQSGIPEMADMEDQIIDGMRTNDGCITAISTLDMTKVPEKYKSLIGKKFDVFGNLQKKVTVTVKALKLMVRYIPHFGQEQNWPEDISDKEKALDVWNTGKPIIVAEFEIQEKINYILEFALPHPSANIPLYSASKDINSQTKKNIEMKLQKVCNWWNKEQGSETFEEYKVNDQISYYLIHRKIGDNCSSDEVRASLYIFKAEGNILTLEEELKEEISSIVGMDINGDRMLEFLVDDSYGKKHLLHPVNNKWILDKEYSVDYFDCPC